MAVKYSSDVIVLSGHSLLRRDNLSFPQKRNQSDLIISTVSWNHQYLPILMIPFMSSAVVGGITGLGLLHVAVCMAGLEKIKKEIFDQMWGVIESACY